jgi:DNA polymerase-3 subunit epsilon
MPFPDSARVSLQPSQNSTPPELPVRYYLDHFNEFLGVIEDRYTHVLEPTHASFIDDFRYLNGDAQCLYVRMLNRRGRLFDSRRFKYPEIDDIPAQLIRLRESGFSRSVAQDDLKQWFELITRDALLDLISHQCSPGSFRRSWSKSALVEFAQGNVSFKHPSIAPAKEPYVVQTRCEQIGYLLFLYFGKFESGLSRFTLRDLGVVKTSSFKKTFEPRFDDKDSAVSTWFYCQKLSDVQSMEPKDYEKVADTIITWPDAVGEQSRLMRQQTIYRLGEQVEKYGNMELAANIYQQSDGWPASERLIRLMYISGDRDQACTRLERMIDDPSCDEELLFATDFYQRKFHKKRTSRITDILRNGAVINLDECHRDAPEKGAADYFRSHGAQVFHTENRLWKKLFGLLFWEILYKNEASAIYNDFEKRPKNLETGTFYARFNSKIEKILSDLKDSDATLRTLLSTVTREYGTANSIFRWNSNMMDEIRVFLPNAPSSAVACILRRMAQDYAGNHSGFPDLLVVEQKRLRFIEVKAEGDQLRRNQLKQFVAMEQAGFLVEVNRIEWVVDPEQVYVVVDIETTGRRSASNRITEIAAVKMQHGEVLDRWQSLINPCRSIPRNITDLTGISNEMAADAPVFAEIAEDFRAFTEGAVFVAHNVRFDYSFIGDEYRRLQQTYQRPTLCSCAQMRKCYPGFKSYSLKNLCEKFEISLESHHRAMCDAEAAAELLTLINQKRTVQN